MPHPRSYADARAMLDEYENRTHYRVLYFNPPLSLSDVYQDGALAVKDGIGREIVRYYPDGRIRLTVGYRSPSTYLRLNGLIPQGWHVEEHSKYRSRLVSPTGAQMPFARIATFHPADQHSRTAQAA
jgi:hypothetical protein